ncbi:MAG: SDR family NAD(P)-dependent oxidoreductase [Geminicoccaceae bacterium]
MATSTSTILITGANAGIGLAAAKALAAKGFHVVMHARSEARGKAALDEVRRGQADAKLDLVLADFAELDQVRKLAEVIRDRFPKLDILANNAGLMLDQPATSRDGNDMVFQINHLAPFLLTHLLLDHLEKSAPVRIIGTASRAHRMAGPLELDQLNAPKPYAPFKVYARSKLCNILFNQELARRLEGKPMTANCFHPGVVRTGFAQDGDTHGLWALGMTFARFLMIPPERGASTLIYLATSPDVEGTSGKYFDRCAEIEPKPFARDHEAARRLWDYSAELTGVS